MANITTVGNPSGLLTLPDSFGDEMASALEAQFNNFVLSTNHIGSDLDNEFYNVLGASSTSLFAYLYGAADGYLTILGSGFDTPRITLNSLQFEGDNGLNWLIQGKIATTASGDIASGASLTKLSFWNDAHTDELTIEGKFKEDDNVGATGTVTKLTLVHDDVTFVLTGKFSLDSPEGGKFSGFTMSDHSGNSINITGKVSMGAFLDAEGSLFDNPGLLSGKDVFQVSDGGRTWYGFAGKDVMTGGALADSFDGGADADTLNGAGGDDTLNGGTGKDKIAGGSGHDQFIFDNLAVAGADAISDFSAADDVLVFDDAVFVSLAGGIDASELVIGANPTAQDANDYLLFNTATGNLYYDADGSGGGAAVLVATVKGSLAGIDADNFAVV